MAFINAMGPRLFPGAYTPLAPTRAETGVTALERGGMHRHLQKPPQDVWAAQVQHPGASCPKP